MVSSPADKDPLKVGEMEEVKEEALEEEDDDRGDVEAGASGAAAGAPAHAAGGGAGGAEGEETETETEEDAVGRQSSSLPPRSTPTTTSTTANASSSQKAIRQLVLPTTTVRRGGTRGSTKAAAAAAAAAAAGTSSSTLTGDGVVAANAGTATAILPAISSADAIAHASFVQASALVAQQGFPAAASLLGGASSAAASSASSAPIAASDPASTATGEGAAGTDAVSRHLLSGIEAAATKLVSDSPPWVHWNKSDMAPQLKIGTNAENGNNNNGTINSRTILLGSYRGYRMARANAGISSGVYYYEMVILPAPSAKEIASQLPPAVRLGPGLEKLLKLQLEQEEIEARQESAQMQQQSSLLSSSDREAAAASSSGSSQQQPQQQHPNKRIRVGGHVRFGWSMRTGELQAPVGYDKWSYAIRDIGGSLVHKSLRQDVWGGEGAGFGPGDVVGCGIFLDGDNPHIRFFLSGECLGNFVISKGKRVGGVAFSIEPGCYYPAVSLYMGGGVRANFGPHWIYPPRKLPTGFPKFQPVSSVVSPPKSPAEAVMACDKAIKLLRKPEHQRALKAAIEIEAKIQCESYDRYYASQLEFVRREREDRGLTTTDIKERLLQLQQQEEAQQQPVEQPTSS
jgi:Set1/Ash2 histone methyltransferase complex subunit ASH2